MVGYVPQVREEQMVRTEVDWGMSHHCSVFVYAHLRHLATTYSDNSIIY